MTTREILLRTRSAMACLQAMDEAGKNAMLLAMADRLQEHRTDILRENAADMEAARGHLSEGMLDRLLLNNDRIDSMAAGIRALTALPDHTGRTLSEVIRPNGMVIRKVQMIFQDPMASLNERAKVEYIVAEGLLNHHLYKDQNDLHEKVMNALHEVGLLPEFASRFPHEFSGGQRQRIGIARALVMEPEFIVADEPISALDVSIRAQVLNLLNSMKKSRGLTYLFIAHDLSVVRFISDRIAVISKGRIVELAEAEELFLHPLHPYTKALLSAVPIPDPGLEKKKKLLVYDPSIHDYSVDKPVWEEIANGHFVYGNQKELEGYRKEYQSQL